MSDWKFLRERKEVRVLPFCSVVYRISKGGPERIQRRFVLVQSNNGSVSAGAELDRRLREKHAEVVRSRPKGFGFGVPGVVQAHFRETGGAFAGRK